MSRFFLLTYFPYLKGRYMDFGLAVPKTCFIIPERRNPDNRYWSTHPWSYSIFQIMAIPPWQAFITIIMLKSLVVFRTEYVQFITPIHPLSSASRFQSISFFIFLSFKTSVIFLSKMFYVGALLISNLLIHTFALFFVCFVCILFSIAFLVLTCIRYNKYNPIQLKTLKPYLAYQLERDEWVSNSLVITRQAW